MYFTAINHHPGKPKQPAIPAYHGGRKQSRVNNTNTEPVAGGFHTQANFSGNDSELSNSGVAFREKESRIGSGSYHFECNVPAVAGK